ncbi:Uncharacterized protein BM_BM18090 [Brugia malayi]|uniref:Uncharacterized protein n=1 Tax=Brugia malayi TaxID=6279 RepID=A0A4E9F1M8_BRUMA|nr:Uncharacterized protein BM_BM18090 [Brugia malayi]VIO89956.1 Uncharacterized protein BM_BM18090 [Brugia malayi]
MAAVRDSLCNMEPVQIPRPQISGLQFIPTRGRLGFYATIRRDGEKYGVGMKPIGPRRPVLSESLFKDDCNISKTSNIKTTNEGDKMENVKLSPKQDLQSVKTKSNSMTNISKQTNSPTNTSKQSFQASENEKINLNKVNEN